MLLIKLIKLEVALSVLELPTKEKQQSYGIRKQENQFTMQQFGKIEEPKNTVKNLKTENMKMILEKKQDCLLILIFQLQK